MSAETTKLIHYASFEREVLGRYGFSLDAVLDTRDVSRELGIEIDKREQTGD